MCVFVCCNKGVSLGCAHEGRTMRACIYYFTCPTSKSNEFMSLRKYFPRQIGI
uniref:Uncharacterized protein n=1 Tax=Setaria italica TaxID=4555 RepID=K3YXN2_SETIT